MRLQCSALAKIAFLRPWGCCNGYDVGQAIARAGRSDQSFNIETYPEPPVEGDDPTSSIVAMTRRRYARNRRDVEAELGLGSGDAMPEDAAESSEELSDPSEDDLVT